MKRKGYREHGLDYATKEGNNAWIIHRWDSIAGMYRLSMQMSYAKMVYYLYHT